MSEKAHPFHLFKYCPICGSDKFLVNNSRSKKCESCGFTYYFNASSATVAVIVNSKKEILVATRANDPAKGTLDLPGGFTDAGETVEFAVTREVREETGMTVKSVKYLFSIPNVYVYSGFTIETTDLFFLCEVDADAAFEANDDVSKLEFVPIEKLNVSDFGLESIKKGVERIKNMNW